MDTFDLAQTGPGMAQEDLAGRGELDTSGMTLKQQSAKVLVELLDLPAERGLRDVKLLGGLPDRAAKIGLVRSRVRAPNRVGEHSRGDGHA
jgi:hypothetical protein